MSIVEIMAKSVREVDLKGQTPTVCISGGIDSTVVLHHVVNDLMNGHGENVWTFTAAFDHAQDERDKAKAVANYYNTRHFEINITKERVMNAYSCAMRVFPFPRFNLWPWVMIENIRYLGFHHLFIGEGSDEIFGYSDRSFMDGWAGQLVWVYPAWEISCKYFDVELHAPFMDLAQALANCEQFYHPPDKIALRTAYKGIIPNSVRWEKSTPPSHGFYEMMGMSKEQLQLEVTKIWLKANS